MPLPKDTAHTIDEIYALPEGQRAELIDGTIYMMSPPNRIHQKLVSEFTRTIGNYIESHGGSCEVYPAPFAVFLNQDTSIYVEPDISVICDSDKLTEKGCNGSPDWIIEVVSPASQRMDYLTKLFKYRTAGVREYWIVDPSTRTVTVYQFASEESAGQYRFDKSIPCGIFEEFQICIAALLR